jgi:hypothetical protein
LAIAVFAATRKPAPKVFNGYLEVRALLADGKYTSLEAPDLGTFAGRTQLREFLVDSLGVKAERMMESVGLGDITIAPGYQNGEPVLLLQNKSACVIMDNEQVFNNKIVWQDNRQLFFTQEDSPARLEITYRASID